MKVYFDTVGCRLNQAEIEQMAREFRAAGHELVASPAEAELAVVNTCLVTTQAASDSRSKIRQIARAGDAEIIATGCWATLYPEQAAALPGVRRVVANDHKDRLPADLFADPGAEHPFDLEPLARTPIPGLRQRTRAFIKVQDGCDNRCTFCITTLARGSSRSVPAESVLEAIRAALAGGAQEIVLTGVHLGAWGQDLGLHLRDLVRAILHAADVPRLRLSSLEPWDLDEAFFSLWQDARLCPHLHLPLQSGSRSVLRRMARKTTPESFRALAAAARQVSPEMAITTDVIAGFPGESDEEFEETMAFVHSLRFAGGHVFTYSARPGTAAARMPGQVQADLKKQRGARLREAFARSAEAYRRRFLGRELSVLWEAASRKTEDGWLLDGLTDNYIRVSAAAPELRWNRMDTVRLLELTGEGLRGEISP